MLVERVLAARDAGPAPEIVRVLVADRDEALRARLRRLLQRDRRVTFVGEAATGRDALVLARRRSPHILLADVALAGLARKVLEEPALESIRVVLLGAPKRREHLVSALRAGASGVIAEVTGATQLVEALRLVAGGGAVLVPGGMLERAAQPGCPEPSADRFASLTVREAEITRLVARGLRYAEIAERLVLSPETIKTHVRAVMRKLGVRDRAELIVLAYESGLVRPRQEVPPCAG